MDFKFRIDPEPVDGTGLLNPQHKDKQLLKGRYSIPKRMWGRLVGQIISAIDLFFADPPFFFIFVSRPKPWIGNIQQGIPQLVIMERFRHFIPFFFHGYVPQWIGVCRITGKTCVYIFAAVFYGQKHVQRESVLFDKV